MDNLEKAERNKKLILRYSTTLNSIVGVEKYEEAIRKFTDNEGYVRTVMTVRNAFPDYSIFIEDITAEGDFVIAHGLMRGTHMGDIFGVPATFRKVELPLMVKYHVVNDRIINAWPMTDNMELFEQLGAISKPT